MRVGTTRLANASSISQKPIATNGAATAACVSHATKSPSSPPPATPPRLSRVACHPHNNALVQALLGKAMGVAMAGNPMGAIRVLDEEARRVAYCPIPIVAEGSHDDVNTIVDGRGSTISPRARRLLMAGLDNSGGGGGGGSWLRGIEETVQKEMSGGGKKRTPPPSTSAASNPTPNTTTVPLPPAAMTVSEAMGIFNRFERVLTEHLTVEADTEAHEQQRGRQRGERMAPTTPQKRPPSSSPPLTKNVGHSNWLHTVQLQPFGEAFPGHRQTPSTYDATNTRPFTGSSAIITPTTATCRTLQIIMAHSSISLRELGGGVCVGVGKEHHNHHSQHQKRSSPHLKRGLALGEVAVGEIDEAAEALGIVLFKACRALEASGVARRAAGIPTRLANTVSVRFRTMPRDGLSIRELLGSYGGGVAGGNCSIKGTDYYFGGAIRSEQQHVRYNQPARTVLLHLVPWELYIPRLALLSCRSDGKLAELQAAAGSRGLSLTYEGGLRKEEASSDGDGIIHQGSGEQIFVESLPALWALLGV